MIGDVIMVNANYPDNLNYKCKYSDLHKCTNDACPICGHECPLSAVRLNHPNPCYNGFCQYETLEIDWIAVWYRGDWSEDFVVANVANLNVPMMVGYQKFPENILEAYAERFSCNDWTKLSIHQDLSESFIRKFEDQVDWNCISQCQNLSESFIHEFADKVAWGSILACGRHAHLSEDFIRRHKKYIKKKDWRYINPERRWSDNFLTEFANRIGWKYVAKLHHLPEAFVRVNADKIN